LESCNECRWRVSIPRSGVARFTPVQRYRRYPTELSAAGFAKVGVEKVTKLLRTGSAREAAVSLCHGGLVRAAIEAQMPNRLDEITQAATTPITARFGSGPTESLLSTLLFTAARGLVTGIERGRRAG
jgi:hypothetical protein